MREQQIFNLGLGQGRAIRGLSETIDNARLLGLPDVAARAEELKRAVTQLAADIDEALHSPRNEEAG